MKNYSYVHIDEEETKRGIMVVLRENYSAINLYHPPDEENMSHEAGRYIIETKEDFDKLWNFLMTKEPETITEVIEVKTTEFAEGITQKEASEKGECIGGFDPAEPGDKVLPNDIIKKTSERTEEESK